MSKLSISGVVESSQKAMKKIAVFTATRAEYGLLYWLMKDIDAHEALQLQLLVSGTHLSEDHGQTIDQILKDGFKVDAQINLGLSEKDRRIDVAYSMSVATKGVADALSELTPDILVLLGDRYELLGAASAALVMGVPIFHLHGGEVTEGAYDDSIRHAVTKMATWHGVANQEYLERVIRMGEPAEKVFNVGAMGLDNIKRLPLLGLTELERQLNFSFGKKTILVTYHPVTNADNPVEGFFELLSVLAEYEDLHVIFTHPNADHGRNEIVQGINNFVAQNAHRSMVKESLGQNRFLSVLKYVDVIVGNSSSGIIEAPSMSTPTLNIGDRQKGRNQASTIIDSDADFDGIRSGLDKALAFRFSSDVVNPYAQGDPARDVVNILLGL
ncbi:MAG: UDP-N-acetylglucosamine 2-epimerase [Arenicella sp.]